ncbi:unnamed protein product, partial [marine sediment metagenome]
TRPIICWDVMLSPLIATARKRVKTGVRLV